MKVEVAFNAGYSTPAASRTWTDITAYVLPIHAPIVITHGRKDELATADANTLSLTLKNSDGRFTPGRTSSPYYPNVKLGRPIRVTTTPVGGTASIRFTGYVDEWPLEWPAVVGTFATTTITATSRLARLGISAPLSNIIAEEYRRDSPAAHYQLDGLSDATGKQSPLLRTGTGTAVNFTNATGPGTDGLTAATFAGGEWLVKRWEPVNSAAPVCAVEFFLLTSTPNKTVLAAPDETSSSTGRVYYVEIDTNGKLVVGQSQGTDALPAGWSITSTNSVADGTTRHIAIVTNLAETRLYINGSLDVDTFNKWAGFNKILSVGGSATYDPNFIPRGAMSGVIAHLAVYDTTLAAGRIFDHATAGLSGFAGEAPYLRVARYAIYAGVPDDENTFDADTSPAVAHVDTTGQSALDLMLRVAKDTAGSLFFDGRDGNLHYHARSRRYDAAAAFTLDIAMRQVQPGATPQFDDQQLINEVTTTLIAQEGLAVRAVDGSSQDDNGPRVEQIELVTEDIAAASDAAWWRVNTYAEPRTRIPDLSLDLLSLPAATQAAVLASTVGSMFTVTNWPTQNAATTASFFIEGYTETIGIESYGFSLNVSPAELWLETFKVGDNPRGTLDSIYRIAY